MFFRKVLPRLPVSKKPALPECHPYFEKHQPVLNPSKLELAITTTHRSSKAWPTFPCSLWFETNAKVKVCCVNVNCKFEEDREWQGLVIGNGIHGFVNALLLLIKKRTKAPEAPLMGLLTVCVKCCSDLDFCYETEHINPNIYKTPGSLIFALSNKGVEAMVSSKVIILEGVFMNVIKTVGVDGQWKAWHMLTPIFKNS